MEPRIFERKISVCFKANICNIRYKLLVTIKTKPKGMRYFFNELDILQKIRGINSSLSQAKSLEVDIDRIFV
jgi:hypothetical protein